MHDPHHEPDPEREQLGYAEGELVGPSEPREPDPSEQVRLWTTEKLQEMIASLEPYTNGTLGEISPRHATARLAAIRELNRLWQAHVLPDGEDVTAELQARHQEELERVQEEIAEQVRAQVEAEQEQARREQQEALERLALEQAARARERVLSGITELRRRAPGVVHPDQGSPSETETRT